jgi:hypothetical protein
MSTLTGTNTPPFSVNPFQTFVTYDQARRAAKGASVVAWVIAVPGVWVLGRFLLGGTARQFDSTTILMIVPATLVTIVMGLLGWRIWVRPGPWKIFPLLAFVAWDLVRVIAGISSVTVTFVLILAIIGLVLDVCLIAFRGALAMKRLKSLVDIDVF